MLSHKVLKRKDLGKTSKYYDDGADDYYAHEGEASAWQGRGAEFLGLKGKVDRKRFVELLAGDIMPGTYISRSATRGDSDSRIGIDLTFSAPKSVSLQSLVGGDSRIIAAHDRAVSKAISLAEERAQARIKMNGKSRVETTGNLVVGKFRHETSRELDPQLHTHAVIMNLTRRSDGQWRALKNDEIIKMVRYLGAAYRTELAEALQELGYTLRYEKGGHFELAHIGREQIKVFSQRSAQVEERLRQQGLDRETATTEEKQAATMQSRARKVSAEREALHADWKSRAADVGIDFEARNWAGRGDGHDHDAAGSGVAAESVEGAVAQRALSYALNHLTERQSIVCEHELIDVAMNHAIGRVKLPDLVKAMKVQEEEGFLIREAPLYRPAGELLGAEHLTRESWIAKVTEMGLAQDAAVERVDTAIVKGGLIAADARFTTRTAWEREKSILRMEESGRDAMMPIMEPAIAQKLLQERPLNGEQHTAALQILSTKNRISGVQGYAGVGKSHMLQPSIELAKQAGFNIRALAPNAAHVKALQEFGVEASTLASFEKAKDKKINSKTIIVLDEAGTVPSRLMESVFKEAERVNARVVLLGDTAQTKAIEAGKPFHQLQKAGMETAIMQNIQRQKDPVLKDAVELAAKGLASPSLSKLRQIKEIGDGEARRTRLVEDYMRMPAEERERTLIVSGTNAARRDINGKVRTAIGLAGTGRELFILTRTDTTQEERRFSRNYAVGEVVQPERDYPSVGMERGELYKILDIGPGNRLTVQKHGADPISFSPMTYSGLSVYRTEKTEMAVGDRVRVTRNDASLDIANGDRFEVTALAEGKIVLSNGKRQLELPTDKPVHLDHAYATTVYSSQGLTMDRVLADMETGTRTTSKESYYVAISRAKYEARVYTDDIDKLPAAISREHEKHAALELIRGQEKERQEKDQDFEKAE